MKKESRDWLDLMARRMGINPPSESEVAGAIASILTSARKGETCAHAA